MVLAADGGKPSNIEETLALNAFLTSCLKRYYHIDAEMFDIEVQKSYRQMEMIIEDAHSRNAAPAPQEGQELPPEVVQMMAQEAVAPLAPFPEGELPEAIEGDSNIREFPAPAPEVDTDADVDTDETTDEDDTAAEVDNGEVVGDVVATDTDAEVAVDEETTDDENTDVEPADTEEAATADSAE
jgi:hypothetical protein